ncbi:MAG: CDP-alcohol phosphatidyltransferase family protein [Ruminococcaceae bacterium]|nr:CDP-alcohol phosphatidyltransferase family protein [Oscillospiraceae bacterium]
MFKRFKGEFFTIPNILSYVRIILVPFIVWSYCSLHMYYLSAALIVLSGLTDFVDGYIARHYGMITDFGKIIDPIADKLTQITVVACLAYKYQFMFVLIGVLIFKEIFVGVMGFAVLKVTDVVDGSRWYGKVATIVFYLIMTVLLVFKMSDDIANLLILLCLIGMVVSLVLYTVRYTRILAHTVKKTDKVVK